MGEYFTMTFSLPDFSKLQELEAKAKVEPVVESKPAPWTETVQLVPPPPPPPPPPTSSGAPPPPPMPGKCHLSVAASSPPLFWVASHGIM